MLKYVTIPDIRRYSSYRSINARILYMHLAMSMDIGTRTYAHSWRQLSADLDMPLQQLRTALKQLEKDGLVATQQVTQTVTYGVTQRVTHKVTQIYIMSVSDLDEATNEATNSPTNSPTNSQSNSDKNNIIIPKSQKATHTTARVDWSKKAEEVGQVLKLSLDQASQMVDDFRTRQEWKGKSWESEGDLLAHLVAWCEKRLPLQPMGKKEARRSEDQIRKDERERTKEEHAKETEQDKERNRIGDAYDDWCRYKNCGDPEKVKETLNKYWTLRRAYEARYGQYKAS